MALTPGKAKKMLSDGTVHGQSLSDKQKRYFGAIAGGATPMKAINGGWLDKYAMGGSLPGASGMMYSRNSGSSAMSPPNLTKAQYGDKYTIVPEDGIQLDEVVITGRSNERKKKDEIREELFKDMPDYLRYGDDDRVLSLEQQQQLKDLGITDVASYNEYFGTSYSKDNAGNEFNYLNSYKPEREELIRRIHGATNTAAKNVALFASLIPSPISGASLLSRTPQAYKALAGPVRQAYNFTANSPVGKAAFKYIGEPFKRFTNYKPGGGPFSIGNYADAASVGYGGYNIAPDVKELYNNPSWSAAGNVGLDALSLTPLLNKRFTDAVLPKRVRNITKYYTKPLGDAYKIGMDNPDIPTFLTRGKTPPNPLIGNSKIDADRFMQIYTNPKNSAFMSRFDDQIMKPFPGGTMNENYLRVQTRELNVLQQELDEFIKTPGAHVLPKAKALQKSITQLENNINGFWKTQYPTIARKNMEAIQAGTFKTTFSSADLGPGVGGTYWPPTANQPLNTWKYMFPNQPNTVGIGNNSAVKLREVPVGATEAVKNAERTKEMLTGIHETLGHASNAGGYALTKQTNDLIRGALKPNPKIKDGTSEWVQKFFKDPKATFKDWTKYLQDETEMVARVMELRRQYIDPKYWGTGKQYDIPDKLIDRIFRDGLSGKSKIHADFFRVIDKKGLQKLMKGLYATIPMAIGADGLLEYKHGGNVPKAQGGILRNNLEKESVKGIGQKVADIASSMEANEEDGGRPPLSIPDYARAFFDKEGLCRDNTCVQTVKDFYSKVGVKAMPDDVYDNRTFLENFKEYGFEEILDQKNLQPGDVLQYYYGPDGEDVKEDPSYLNFPYHMGVYVNPGEYIGDGDSEAPIQRKNMYTYGDGDKKDPFRAFRYIKENKNGGWLDKFQEGGVIEDDRGQWAHPGKITKINSNKITMKGVNYPVLGISDTGDKKMMQPGKDYKFGGNSVTEYPMAQEGLKLKKATPSFPYINRVPDTSPQVEFLKNWTNSPRGQELLSNSFDGDEKDIERVTNKRINNLDNIDISMDDHASDFLGRYNRNRHDIKLNSSLLDTSEPKLIGNQDEDVILHELSHAQDFSPGAEFNRLTMPFSDQKLIKNYRKKALKETKNLDVERKTKKDIKNRVNYIGDPTETRARLNSIRYFYETSPIGKEEGMPSIMDSEVTPEMMEVMKDNAQFKELREVYDDDEILELLNTVSDNSKSSGPSNMAYAQEGDNIPLKTVNEFGELKSLTYPSSVFQTNEGEPQQLVMLDPAVVTAKGPITSAKEQMEKYGITNELAKGYVPNLSERALNNIIPQDYGDITKNLDRYRRFKGNLGRPEDALWYDDPKSDNPRKYTIPNREDAFRLYLGMPQVNNSFSVSNHRPGDSEDKSMVYLKPTYFKNPEIRQELLDNYFSLLDTRLFNGKRGRGNERSLSRGEYEGDGKPWPTADNALGDFTFDMGEDENGSYISIYDIWDLNPFNTTGEGSSINRTGKALLKLFNTKSGKNATENSEVSEIFGAGKPFEIYERIYFDPKTKKILDMKQMKQGGSLEKKAQFTNFTNYNTPQPVGWLDKY